MMRWSFTLITTVLICTLASSTSSTSSSHYACDNFKAPNNDNEQTDDPVAQVQAWAEADAQLWQYVHEKVPSVLDHTGSAAFDEHLKGVQAVLRYWNSSATHLQHAGLFHSIYGTEGFQGFALPLKERSAIQQLIGVKAERLCFIFCMVDRSTVDESVFKYWQKGDDITADEETVYATFRARPELGRFDIHLTKEEWVDFIELTLADWLEQVEGAATKPSSIFLWKKGEAYAYRRLAYQKMSEILGEERQSTIPKQMLEAVMATEGKETRHLVQPRTPPMSEATKAAYDALRASGDDSIPLDFAPQPDSTLLAATATTTEL